MLTYVALAALLMSLLNWLLFVALVVFADLPQIKRVLDELHRHHKAIEARVPELDAKTLIFDPGKLADATGTLAGAFKKAGAAPTAAAMSVLCLLIALIAAGVGHF